MNTNHTLAASALGMTVEQYIEYQIAKVDALNRELKKAYKVILEMAEVSTECAKHIEIIIQNEQS